MPKGQKKHIDKEPGKTNHEVHRSVNYRATQNKNNIGTTALERSVVYTTAFHSTRLIINLDTTRGKNHKGTQNTELRQDQRLRTVGVGFKALVLSQKSARIMAPLLNL